MSEWVHVDTYHCIVNEDVRLTTKTTWKTVENVVG